MRHNKKRNTAFLYETILREYTRAKYNKNINIANKCISLLKEYFSKNKILYKHLQIYKSLYKNTGLTDELAREFLKEARRKFDQLDSREIFNTQTRLINDSVNKYSLDIFSNFIKNYRLIASVDQFLRGSETVEETIHHKKRITESLTSLSVPEKMQLDTIDEITYRNFVKRFNQEYGKVLNEGQKRFLKSFIQAESVEEPEFKLQISKEISKLEEVFNSFQTEDIELKEMMKEAIQTLKHIDISQIDERDVENILRVQQIASVLEE